MKACPYMDASELINTLPPIETSPVKDALEVSADNLF